eukprot:m.5726 g.5726  ORF g.5726 m.5726 type:complete len:637 (-) comp4604_c0_seq1:35-1945(-)
MARALLWLRCDLRLHDNVLFAEAVSRVRAGAVAEVLPVYVFDERQFQDTSLGFHKTGPLRAKFLLESVSDLKSHLRSIGSDLLVASGRPELVLPSLLASSGKNVILTQREVTSEELSVDAGVKRACGARAKLELLWGATMIHVDDLPYPPEQVPNTFTSFRKRVEETSQPRALLPTPTRGQLPLPKGGPEFGPHSLALEPTWQGIPILGSTPAPGEPDARGVLPFRGGERAALARLAYYFDASTRHLARYFDTRNGLLGPDYSTKFAPWLALGCLSPRIVFHRVKEFEQKTGIANQSTYWVLFEMLWRDFFRFYALKHGTKIFLPGGPIDSDYRWPRDMALFGKWVAGQTGAPFVDACMRELAATGFMSNRGRQNVASYLVHDLNVDWRLGAMYFESVLLDYDVCSNYGNWVSIAGLTGGRVNVFNIAKQALEYDPDGAFVRHWVPELARLAGSLIHGPHRMSAADLAAHGIVLGTTYPAPAARPRAVPVAGVRDFRGASGGGQSGGGHSGSGGRGAAANGGGSSSARAPRDGERGRGRGAAQGDGGARGGAGAAATSVTVTDKRSGGRGARSVSMAAGDVSTTRTNPPTAVTSAGADPEGIAHAGPHTAQARWAQKRYEPPARVFQPKSDWERFG